jgi:hypothetical protein
MPKAKIHMQVICVDPPDTPAGFQAVNFGLQDKDHELLTGHEMASDRRCYPFSIEVEQHKDGSPNFTGIFAHGSHKDRFLYLTLKGLRDDGNWHIIKRIKITLKSITWGQVEKVLRDEQKQLTVMVSGQGSATVPLLDDGWVITDVEPNNPQ